jgi:hypothetical protein
LEVRFDDVNFPLIPLLDCCCCDLPRCEKIIAMEIKIARITATVISKATKISGSIPQIRFSRRRSEDTDPPTGVPAATERLLTDPRSPTVIVFGGG